MTPYETGLALGAGLCGFIMGLLSFLAVYYCFIRGHHDYTSKISVGVLVSIGMVTLFQAFIMVAYLTQ